MGVPARVSIVTLGVVDLERSRSFYEALGWELASSSVSGVIYWFPTADTYLGLFGYESLAADAQLPASPRAPFAGFTLAICVESNDAVVSAIEVAANAGGTVLKPAAKAAEFDGFHGYFADPDGYPWEVAYNPNFPIRADGRISID
jgi:catechol 2,3-dioxygenase-like lactoylglutathione lyase family enzyme